MDSKKPKRRPPIRTQNDMNGSVQLYIQRQKEIDRLVEQFQELREILKETKDAQKRLAKQMKTWMAGKNIESYTNETGNVVSLNTDSSDEETMRIDYTTYKKQVATRLGASEEAKIQALSTRKQRRKTSRLEVR